MVPESVVEQYDAMAGAFLGGPLHLLRKRSAREIMSVLRAVFPSGSTGLSKHDLLAELDDLATVPMFRDGTHCEDGSEDGDAGRTRRGPLSGSEWFTRLTAGPHPWIEGRRDRASGVSMLYYPTPAALSAMDVIDQLSSRTAALSETRVSSVISLLGDARVFLSGDFSTALEVYRERAEAAQARYEALKERGSLDELSPEVAEAKMGELLDQWRGVPATLAEIVSRVSSRGEEMQSEFLRGERPAGVVGAEALNDMDRISGRLEGETNDAMRMLIDRGRSESMRRAIDDISRLFRQRGIDGRWAYEMERAWEGTFEGVSRVMGEIEHQARVVAKASGRIDMAGALERISRLSRLEQIAVAHARADDARPTRPQSRRMASTCAPILDVVMPRKDPLPPPPVVEPTFAPIEDFSDTRWHAPEQPEVLLALMAPLDGGTVAVRFNQLESDVRRPVEVYGLLAMAGSMGAGFAGESEWRVVEQDGRETVWLAPDVEMRSVSDDADEAIDKDGVA